MKKTLIISLFLYFLGFSHFVFAIEGDCSYHGGIDCSAGADVLDGSVICNDGWRDSKDNFSDAVMCSSEDKWSDYLKQVFELCDWTKIPSEDLYIIVNVRNDGSDKNEVMANIEKLQKEVKNLKIGEAYKIEELQKKIDAELKKINEATKPSFEIAVDMATYCENNNLWKNHEEEAQIKEITKITVQNPFSDFSEEYKNHEAIIALYKQGVINGYDDGTFKPNNTVNRAELLKILVNSKEIIIPVGEYQNCFTDVNEEWFAPYVCYAKEQGWIQGYEDGTFKPAQIVNKVEALKMLMEIYGIDTPEASQNNTSYSDVDTNAWYWKYISKAYELGVIEDSGNLLAPSSGMRRGSFCESLYRLTK